MYLSIAFAKVGARINWATIRAHSTLTDNCFYIFCSSIRASFCLERVACAKGKGQCFAILAQEVVDFASEESSGITGIFRKILRLIQALAGTQVDVR